MDNIKFSIITASYNYENYIKETIESVLAQTYANWEMIIVDDGSKDNSIEVIKSYCKKDNRIKLFTHENNQNKGLIETVKLGIKKAENDWIVFLESDDTITPDYLQKKLEVIQKNPEVKFIYNDVALVGDEDRIEKFIKHFEYTDKLIKENPYPQSQLQCFKHTNLVPTFSVVMLKKELLNNIDYNCPIKSILDYYLWMQIARKTSLYYIDEKLTNWRLHNESYMGRNNIAPEKEQFAFRCKRIEFLSKTNNKLLISLKIAKEKIKKFKRKIIKFHLRKRELFLFGKKYNF